LLIVLIGRIFKQEREALVDGNKSFSISKETKRSLSLVFIGLKLLFIYFGQFTSLLKSNATLTLPSLKIKNSHLWVAFIEF
jgi:hypothetical protein